MKIKTLKAKKISYDSSKKRSLSNIKYIVIHYTANKGDTAENNARYYATGNTRQAGAHFFVDKKGQIYKSIDMNRIAWSVGGNKYVDECKNGGGKYYSVCSNANSISIELCNCVDDINYTQALALRQLVKYIQKKCPNARTIIRHWDVNGKPCPAPFKGTHNNKWKRLYDFLVGRYCGQGKITTKATLRAKPKIGNNKITTIPKGEKIIVKSQVGDWAKINYDGSLGYIALSKITL